MNVLKANHQ